MEHIVLLFSCILELYIFIDFFNAFFFVKNFFQSKWKNYALALTLCLCYFLINTLQLSFLNILSFSAILFIYSSIVYECTLRERLLYIIFICSIFFGCEFLFAVLLNIPSYVVGKKSITDLAAMPWHVFTLKLLTYVICNIFKQFSSKSHKCLNNKVFFCYLCVPFASIGIMLLTYYAGIDFNVSPHAKAILFVYFAIMQFGNIIIFYAFQKYSEELYNSMQQKLIITTQNLKLEHYKQVQAINEQHHEFVHNASHYIKTLGSLIAENQTAAALGIINELNIELESSSAMLFSSNSILNSILTEKKNLAEKQNVNMDIYVEPFVQLENVSEVDLITILCNLLDNAIEASLKCDTQPDVQVRIYMQNQNNICVIKVTNSFNGELKKLGDTLISTKKESGIHGVGLKSISRAAEKYGGYIELYEEDKRFVAVLVLPC